MLGLVLAIFAGLLLYDGFRDFTNLLGRWLDDEREFRRRYRRPSRPDGKWRAFLRRIGY